MNKFFVLAIFLLSCSFLSAQSHAEEVKAFQEKMNHDFSNTEKPLSKKQRKKFKGHDFFEINNKYRVVAKLEKVDNAVPFLMKTTTSRLPEYKVYGNATFIIDGKEFTLPVYQSEKISPGYEAHLFFPFTDMTNGNETYSGGRYIDLTIPEGNSIIIDFNKAYNPYCAYNGGYSCPIPPKENDLPIKILAGTKYDAKKFK